MRYITLSDRHLDGMLLTTWLFGIERAVKSKNGFNLPGVLVIHSKSYAEQTRAWLRTLLPGAQGVKTQATLNLSNLNDIQKNSKHLIVELNTKPLDEKQLHSLESYIFQNKSLCTAKLNIIPRTAYVVITSDYAFLKKVMDLGRWWIIQDEILRDNNFDTHKIFTEISDYPVGKNRTHLPESIQSVIYTRNSIYIGKNTLN